MHMLELLLYQSGSAVRQSSKLSNGGMVDPHLMDYFWVSVFFQQDWLAYQLLLSTFLMLWYCYSPILLHYLSLLHLICLFISYLLRERNLHIRLMHINQT